jgi:hypothetical protein
LKGRQAHGRNERLDAGNGGETTTDSSTSTTAVMRYGR